jgi:hypothetical protein
VVITKEKDIGLKKIKGMGLFILSLYAISRQTTKAS